MSIQGFYNTTAIYEYPTRTIDGSGQLVDTWTVSTTIIGCKQSKSGSNSIVNDQERIKKSEIFFCDYLTSLNALGRFSFINSTISFIFKGNASTDTDLSSIVKGSMYFVSASFSTFVQYDYALYDGTTYITANVIRNKILYINDRLRGRHLEIDLDLDKKT